MENDNTIRRLKTIEGHLRGVIRMVEEDAYCIDVIRQIQAVEAALESQGVDRLLPWFYHPRVGQEFNTRSQDMAFALRSTFSIGTPLFDATQNGRDVPDGGHDQDERDQRPDLPPHRPGKVARGAVRRDQQVQVVQDRELLEHHRGLEGPGRAGRGRPGRRAADAARG